MYTEPTEQAFPVIMQNGDLYPGLTKREWFAGMALQGLLACPNEGGTPLDCAECAVIHADALIAALNKEAKPCSSC